MVGAQHFFAGRERLTKTQHHQYVVTKNDILWDIESCGSPKCLMLGPIDLRISSFSKPEPIPLMMWISDAAELAALTERCFKLGYEK